MCKVFSLKSSTLINLIMSCLFLSMRSPTTDAWRSCLQFARHDDILLVAATCLLIVFSWIQIVSCRLVLPPRLAFLYLYLICLSFAPIISAFLSQSSSCSLESILYLHYCISLCRRLCSLIIHCFDSGSGPRMIFFASSVHLSRIQAVEFEVSLST